MRVRSYDDAAPDLPPDPEHSSLRFKRLCTVQLDRARELEISLVTGAQARSISLRLWRAKGKGRPQVPGQPLHLFPHQLDRVLTALTEAAAVLNDPPEAAALDIPQS